MDKNIINNERKVIIMAYTIAIANMKGGIGKTTSTIELAACLAAKDKRVLVIDFDQQCNLSDYVGADQTGKTIYTLLNVEADPEEVIQRMPEGYDIIPGSAELSKADVKFNDSMDVYILQDLIEVLDSEYDYIIIDNSPARNVLLNMCYVASDSFILCTEADDGSIKGIEAILADLGKYRTSKHEVSHADIMGVIMIRYEKTAIQDAQVEMLQERVNSLDDKFKTHGEPFVKTVRKSIKVTEAKTFKQSVQKYNKYCPPAMDYRKIAEVIIERVEK